MDSGGSTVAGVTVWKTGSFQRSHTPEERYCVIHGHTRIQGDMGWFVLHETMKDPNNNGIQVT